MNSVVAQYRAKFAGQESMATRARSLLPDGVTSDSRRLSPFPLYAETAEGARKWDVEGNEFIDLWSGHGALLFGHASPEMVAATRAQLLRGTHYGACHGSTARWAELIVAALSGAERVRFTASGTEAVQLGLHLARAATGRAKFLRFEGHYHGWSAQLSVGSSERASGQRDPVLERAREVVVTCPNRLGAVAEALRTDPDIGAVILEPTGPCSGVLPLAPEFVRELRVLTREHGSLLIFDEIVTGFRLSGAGAQGLLEVEPDLSTLAKVTCGGLPGGALTGRAELFELLAKDEAAAGPGLGATRLPHLGTFSGNPLSAAAGIATLERIAAEPPYAALERAGRSLREALNRVIDARELDWLVYGQGSCIKLLVGHGNTGLRARDVDLEHPERVLGPARLLARGRAKSWARLRLALLLHGVDMSLSSFVTTAHTDRVIDEITLAFDAALDTLARSGELHA